MRHRICLCTALLLSFFVLSHTSLSAASSPEDDDDRKGSEAADLPTGMHITPTAARGASFSVLRPDLADRPNFTAGHAVTSATSPDGNTLLILTSGYNINYDQQGRVIPGESTEYVFVYDISAGAPKKIQVLQVPRAFDGMAWSPSGNEFYVSGGEEDCVHIFSRAAGAWQEAIPPVRLGHTAGLGLAVKPEVAGLAVNSAGTTLIAANYENDSISVIDLKCAP
jgi:hypothetical protein